jgi:hypothetical protein
MFSRSIFPRCYSARIPRKTTVFDLGRFRRDNAVFPRAPLSMQRADGLSLIDGTHRMAAFVLFQMLSDAQLAEMKVARPSLEQDVWQGSHVNGELPDG